MKANRLSIAEDQILADLLNLSASAQPATNPSHSEWIRILRTYLRMTQAELAERVGIPQSNIASLESGKKDVQITTLRKIFTALSCDLEIKPRPQKSLSDILRNRARSIALKRLRQSMGTMAMEGQSPTDTTFKQLLEKKTDEILNDPREKLWGKSND